MVRFTVDNRNRLIFYGNPVGYVKDDAAVVDEMFRTDELNQYLSRMDTNRSSMKTMALMPATLVLIRWCLPCPQDTEPAATMCRS